MNGLAARIFEPEDYLHTNIMKHGNVSPAKLKASIETRMELSEKDLLAEIGCMLKSSMMGASPQKLDDDVTTGNKWLERNTRKICEKMWNDPKLSSYMLGQQVYDRASAASIAVDLLAGSFGVPLAVAAVVYLIKTGLYETCHSYRPVDPSGTG